MVRRLKALRQRFEYLPPCPRTEKQPHVTFWGDGSVTIRDRTPDPDDDYQCAIRLTAEQFQSLAVKYALIREDFGNDPPHS